MCFVCFRLIYKLLLLAVPPCTRFTLLSCGPCIAPGLDSVQYLHPHRINHFAPLSGHRPPNTMGRCLLWHVVILMAAVATNLYLGAAQQPGLVVSNKIMFTPCD